MKKFLLLSVAATFICSLSFATIRRVGYPGSFRAGVDYATFQEAHDAASNNDTIQIYGAGFSAIVTKPLVIIGFGYNFDTNTGLQAIGTDVPSSATINFGAGSSGGSVVGMSGSFDVGDVYGGSHTLVSNITFTRCNGNFTFYNHESYGPISNIKFISSVIRGGGMSHNGPNDYPVTNLQVYNCIIVGFQLYKSTTTAAFINCAGNQVSLADAGCLVKNGIFGWSYAQFNSNTVYENNFFYETQPVPVVPGSNDRWGLDGSMIYNRLGGTDENPADPNNGLFDEDWYILKAGSPAINGGFNAANQPTNCGIYGGEPAYVYKLSGVPAVPAIYQLTAPSLNASSNPYNVTISVRSNN